MGKGLHAILTFVLAFNHLIKKLLNRTPSTTLIFIDDRGEKYFLMLLIVPKCISSTIILNYVHYHKCHHHHHLQIPSQIVAVAIRRRRPVLSSACLKSVQWPIFIGARSFSTLRVRVVLVRPFWCFPSGRGLPHCRQQSCQTIIIWGSSDNVTD